MSSEKSEDVEIKSKFGDAIKITISENAEAILMDAVKRINEGFEGGRVNRQVAASWLIEQACQDMSDADIREIRADSFDVTQALLAFVKRVGKTGRVPQDFRDLLFAQMGLSTTAKKSSKSKLTKESTNDGFAKQEE
jgi:hypothetical protein